MAVGTPATFNRDDTKWYDTVTIEKQTGSFTIWTNNTYLDRNIRLNYEIPGVRLDNSSSFYITVPNGSGDPVTFHFTVDSSGNTTIT